MRNGSPACYSASRFLRLSQPGEPCPHTVGIPMFSLRRVSCSTLDMEPLATSTLPTSAKLGPRVRPLGPNRALPVRASASCRPLARGLRSQWSSWVFTSVHDLWHSPGRLSLLLSSGQILCHLLAVVTSRDAAVPPRVGPSHRITRVPDHVSCSSNSWSLLHPSRNRRPWRWRMPKRSRSALLLRPKHPAQGLGKGCDSAPS
jgi:hypothetical protein